MFAWIKNLSTQQPGLLILIIILIVNLFFLDAWVVILAKDLNKTSQISKTSELAKGEKIVSDTNVCPASCIAQIKQATSVSPTEALKTQNTTTTQTVNTIKDVYISLGTGNSNASVWTNVPGVQANIDTGGYGKIKAVYFEASLQNPNSPQNVSVRLYNVTTNQPVWFSDMTMQSSNTSQLLTSNPITLTSGNNLYQVQMQTQLQAPANLVQSRIHITLY